MSLNQFAEAGLRYLSAATIVLALAATFEYGHSLSVAGLLQPLFG